MVYSPSPTSKEPFNVATINGVMPSNALLRVFRLTGSRTHTYMMLSQCQYVALCLVIIYICLYVQAHCICNVKSNISYTYIIYIYILFTFKWGDSKLILSPVCLNLVNQLRCIHKYVYVNTHIMHIHIYIYIKYIDHIYNQNKIYTVHIQTCCSPSNAVYNDKSYIISRCTYTLQTLGWKKGPQILNHWKSQVLSSKTGWFDQSREGIDSYMSMISMQQLKTAYDVIFHEGINLSCRG